MPTTPPPARGPAIPAPTQDAAAPLTGLHAQVLDLVGLAICNGALVPGSILRTDDFEERFQVSRSVVREVLRVLASMGMVESRRRVGVQIRPMTRWNLYDPQIIRWRLASSERISQLRSLSELRTAVEPLAARLAAERAPSSETGEIMRVAGSMWAAAKNGDADEFLRLDIQFHQLLLTASGNEMFAQLQTLVAEVLTGRRHYRLTPEVPSQEALQLHMDVAVGIQGGIPEEAQQAMVRIMEHSAAETAAFWEQNHSGAQPAAPAPTAAPSLPSV